MIPTRPARRGGFVLILVLAFIAIVLAVVLAFFSNSILQRQISATSANRDKVDLFAQGCLDTTIGDLQQEIVAGSTATTSTMTGVATLYWPTVASSSTAATTMVPYCVPTATSTLPNLLKTSIASPFYQGTGYSANGPTRASSLGTASSSTHPVSAARWNAALLLPMPSGHGSNLTPISDFTPPNWVYVDSSGANPISPTAATVGRYAYCIYNEGALLDMNVAGYPAEMTGTGASTTSVGQVSHKAGTAFADLTQIGLSSAQIDTLLGWRNYASIQPGGSFPTFTFTAAPLATAAATTAPTASSGQNYFNSIVFNPWGYLNVASGMSAGSPSAVFGGISDQRFTSRQQLINFMTQAPVSTTTDVLQYMGTFSRSLDQPSFRPDPNRPVVTGLPTYTGTGTFPSTAGGNSSGGTGGTVNIQDEVNPSFLSVNVTTSFTRNDGTAAIVGEPLVKKRFALNRLAWLTYAGPSASNMSLAEVQQTIVAMGGNPASTSDPVYQFVALGTAANIFNYFGLTWNGSYWVYSHGVTGRTIGRLSDIAGTREPDFFELLKAGLVVGSLGKASASSTGSATPTTNDWLQFATDTNTDTQALQIGANIIDQFDMDSYPTHIQDSTGATVVYGSENLPGLYRMRAIGVNLTTVATSTATPSAALLLLPEVWNPYANTTISGTSGPTNFRFLVAGDTGTTTQARAVTRTWSSDTYGNNPTPGSPTYSAGSNVFLLTTITTATWTSLDPAAIMGTPYMTSGNGVSELDFTMPIGATAAQSAREPMFVAGRKLAVPPITMKAGPSSNMFNLTNTALGGATSASVDANGYLTDAVTASQASKLAYCGVVLGTSPTTWKQSQTASTETETITFPLSDTKAGAPDYPAATPLSFFWNADNPSSADQIGLTSLVSVEYLLQYKDPSGNWITYQDNYGLLPGKNDYGPGQTSTAKAANTSTLTTSHLVDVAATNPPTETGEWQTWLDPRTSRFGAFGDPYTRLGSASGSGSQAYISPEGYYDVSDRPNMRFGCASFYYTPGTGLTGNTFNGITSSHAATSIGWYPGLWFGGPGFTPAFVPGFYADNVTLARTVDNPTYPGTYAGASYFADPDGVQRRGMGGLAGPNEAAGSSGTLTGSTGVTVGLPLAELATPNPSATTQSNSRPYILNRPFRAVSELGYVFSGTPWRNLDMSSPESGAVPLLDLFTLNETPDSGALVAGKVDLNTRQTAVLQALLSGNGTGAIGSAYKDEANAGVTGTTTELSSSEITAIAQSLVARTTSTTAGQGPLKNVSELVGKYIATGTITGAVAPFNIDGTKSYVGFSSDLVNGSNSLDQVFTNPTPTTSPNSTADIQRLRESAIRALSASGQTRVWNLMIDVVAQTGKFRPGETSLDHFLVDGERRYWLHVAIDRFTGKILDEQLEPVDE